MTTDTKEQWKTIEEIDAYEVSDLGNVRRRLPGKPCGWYGSSPSQCQVGDIVIPSFRGKGYLVVGLFKQGKRYRRSVHRLVAESFVPNPEGFSQINHKGEKTDNRACMLEWISPEEHTRDRVRRGQQGMGGVHRYKGGKWVAIYHLPTTGKRKQIGTFDTEDEARAARQAIVENL